MLIPWPTASGALPANNMSALRIWPKTRSTVRRMSFGAIPSAQCSRARASAYFSLSSAAAGSNPFSRPLLRRCQTFPISSDRDGEWISGLSHAHDVVENSAQDDLRAEDKKGNEIIVSSRFSFTPAQTRRAIRRMPTLNEGAPSPERCGAVPAGIAPRCSFATAFLRCV